MFHRKPLNTAIAMAFGTMAAVSVNVQADSVFFPQIVVSDTVTTIVSVINTTSDLVDSTGNPIPWDKRTGQGFLHYRIFYKDAAKNDTECEEFNTWLPTSRNDIATIDLGAPYNATLGTGAGMLFEPMVTAKVPWQQYDYNLGFQARELLGSGPGGPAVRAFLLVDNEESTNALSEDLQASIFGEAIVLEFANGASWGYSAFSRVDDSNIGPFPDFDDEFDYEDIASRSGYPISMLPFNMGGWAVTSLMTTPVVSGKANQSNKAIIFGKDWWPDSDMSEATDYTVNLRFTDKAPDGSTIVLFDRDETPYSGAVTKTVKCVGKVDARDMFTQSGAVPTLLENGGWGRLANWTMVTRTEGLIAVGSQTQTVAARVDDAAVIYKLEYGASFLGITEAGTFNNAFLIPSTTRTLVAE